MGDSWTKSVQSSTSLAGTREFVRPNSLWLRFSPRAGFGSDGCVVGQVGDP